MENGLIFELKQVTKKLGFSNIHPVILNDAGNLIVHLSPYPIVARIMKLSPEDDRDFWKGILARELKIAQHLEQCHIPIVPFCQRIGPGPYEIGNTWMTLWEYVSINDRKLSICEAVKMLDGMGKAMQLYSGELPRLGAWRNASQAAKRVQEMDNKGYEISLLLEEFIKINDRINHTELLVPSHGDAHPKNLVSTKTGWRWIDFEDVSLMPKFWDAASFLGNKLLTENDKDYIVAFIH
ncbi:aminoglycoside phosphotransferase family protein [Sporolactobacillus shoreicorticis]|uniref:Phosphotransferase family protein n=1 Tax=Sporolactobacillus shoreicorticis TaxID=1923877 RepID=A0ABW5S2H4_9BACL|nr:phosphotransferase [Sporolactobacillus shoreicorticis]MCO7126426.1 aminoglycoside phosphotransferase family protein [Sporolactobacillus shoreicorticis]